MITTIDYNNAPDTLASVWQTYTHDVWGNKTNGFEINNTFLSNQVTLTLKKQEYNIGTPYRFIQYELTDRLAKKALGVHFNTKVTDPYQNEGYVFLYRDKDGYPIGEMNLLNLSGLTLTLTCGITIEDKDVNLENMEYIK
jgi:hypothetical protein